MVTRLMEYSYGRKSELSFGPVKAEELLESVGAIAVPMCVKNNNTVQVLPCGRGRCTATLRCCCKFSSIWW